MLDRATFLRPIAHRGLHDAAAGIIENTWPAFERAIAHGYAIECDLQAAADGMPLVFHDFEFERLIDHPGRVRDTAGARATKLMHRGTRAPILSFHDLLQRIAGRVPLFVEIKSTWRETPDRAFLAEIAQAAARYPGPLALMSFDPRPMVAMRALCPHVPRGLVSGLYVENGWWRDEIAPEDAERLSHFWNAGPVDMSFVSYHAPSLPTPVTRYLREGQGLPVLSWTIRSPVELSRAAAWSDAPTFEGFLP